MATVNQVFPSAPMGRRVVLTLCGVLGVLFLVFVVSAYVALVKVQHAPASARIFQVLAPLFPIAVFAASFLWERSGASQFSIEDNVLVLRKKRYPLQGLVAAERDPQVMRNARRRFGSSGAGSICGKFRSKRLGNFEAFLTDPENAVVLRWPDRVLAVSPADPEFFIYSARAAAGPQ
jgi:PH (Pleckstrin Homology) domain-containing protein